MLPLEHFICSWYQTLLIPLWGRTLFLKCSEGNTAPRVLPHAFFWLASDTQMTNAVRACMQAKPMLSRHAWVSQELCSCQEQQQHTISLRCLAMPDDMQLPTKKWGKVNKAALTRLVHNGDMDINDLSNNNIDNVGKEYFCHRKKKNFCRNFRDFAATFELEAEYSGARRRGGKTMGFSLFYISGHLKTPPPTLGDNICRQQQCIQRQR